MAAPDSRSILGVPTSTTAFVGRTERGPVDRPVTITSFAEFVRTFGAPTEQCLLGSSVDDFFVNGGTTAVIVRAFNPANAVKARIDAGKANPLSLEAKAPGTWALGLRVRVEKSSPDAALFDLRIHDGNAEELFARLTVENVGTVLGDGSMLVDLIGTATQPPEPHDVPADARDLWTDAYSSKVINPDDVKDSDALDENAFGDPGSRRGFGALGAEAFNLLVMPVDEAGDAVQKAVRANAAAFCRAHLAFYIVDPPAQWKTVDDATAIDSVGITGDDARYAAVYFPRVLKPNSFPASGIIAGVMARSDAAHGVWKAPAGTEAVLDGIAGLDIKKPINDRDNGRLNPIGVNCLRQFPVFGNVVWGARTMRGADELSDIYKYIAVRRLANYIEQSLKTGLQWTVFEPNDQQLWEAVRLQTVTFMQSLFLQGAFAGATPSDAYYVTCDNTTTTIVDIENGIVNVIVGFAPVSPAEFVVLQIQAIAGRSGS